MQFLRQHGIIVEYGDAYDVVLLVFGGDPEKDFWELEQALGSIYAADEGV